VGGAGVAPERGEARLRHAFTRAAEAGRAAFVPYLTAGFPDAATSLAAGRALLRHADVLEIGLPYSDPLGDGPIIQRASEAALAAGTRTSDVLALVRTLRAESDAGIVVMTYYNPIYCYRGPGGVGEAGFVRDLADAGADGMILPDLPADEADTLIPLARAADLATVFLVAPTSTDARLATVTQASRGFVYAVSVTGVTGARDSVGAEVASLVARTRALTDLPIAVGFGVASPESAREVATVADGVVVGSALVRTVAEGGDVEAQAAALAAACRR
jgi:tryptophan synthase alpha chain